MMRSCFIVGVVMHLSGCMIANRPAPLEIRGLVFENRTGAPVEHVELRVEGSYAVASCSYIAEDSEFSTVFPLRTYQGKRIKGGWVASGKRVEHEPYMIPMPDPMPDEPVAVVVTMLPEGKASAHFVPESELVSPAKRLFP